MAKYKVDWVTVKTGKSGKNYVEMSLTDSEGKNFPKVTCFDETLQAGMEVEGAIVQNGNFMNFNRLELPDFVKRGNSNYKTDQINKVMDKKNESISHFQDKKEESIALAGAQRDAVLIVTTMFKEVENLPMSERSKVVQESIIKWRNWFLSDDFRLPPPFQE